LVFIYLVLKSCICGLCTRESWNKMLKVDVHLIICIRIILKYTNILTNSGDVFN